MKKTVVLLLLFSAFLFPDEPVLTVLDCPVEGVVGIHLFKAGETNPAVSASAGIENRMCSAELEAAPGTYSVKLFLDADLDGTLSGQETYAEWKTQLQVDLPLKNSLYAGYSAGKLETGTFRFRIMDISRSEGDIRAALFRLTDGQPSKEPFKTAAFPVKGKVAVCECPGIPYGEYAVSILHDADRSGTAEKTEQRLPDADTAEPYAVLKPGAGMKFRETVFLLDKPLYKTEVSLEYGFFRTASLEVTLKGLKSPKGQALLNLFSGEKGFPADRRKAFKYKVKKLTAKTVLIIFEDVPFGVYAVGAVHDEDSNFKLNTNLFGVPREGYGASNDAKGRFGPPSFEDASFTIDRDRVSIAINIVN
jgi:uncharacterized protein (DUF2141 family)